MLDILLVGFGGFLGALARYLFGRAVSKLFIHALFPYTTLFINLLGCLLIGVLSIVGLQTFRHWLPEQFQLFAVIGFLGSFTTFSTFGLETFNLIHMQHPFAATANIILEPLLNVAAVWIGFMLGNLYLI